MGGKLETIHARHLDIQQHDVGHQFLQFGQRIDSVLGGDHLHIVSFQQAGSDLAHGNGVIHHHDRDTFIVRGDRLRGSRRHQLGETAETYQRSQIQDEHHAAIAKDGGAGHTGHGADLATHGFHHDFPAAKQVIHMQGHAVLARTGKQ